MESCCSCSNVGYLVEYDQHGNCAQVQCEFCYTDKDSIFYIANSCAIIQKENEELRAKIARLTPSGGDLVNNIETSQVLAGEQAVMDNLKKLGL